MNNKIQQSFFVKLIEKINIKTWIVVFIVVITLPMLYYSFFSYPLLDDFNNSITTKAVLETQEYAITALINAAITRVQDVYNSWQGTYTSVFIMTFQPGIFGEQYYFMTTWVLLIFTLFSFVYSGKKILNCLNVENKKAYFISLCIWFFYIQTMPDIKEGLFWFNGAMHYIPFLCLQLITMAILISGYKFGFSRTQIILSALFGFLLSGGNQLTAFSNIFIIILINLYAVLIDKKITKIKPLLIPLFVSLMGFAIMLLAPGNAIRQQAAEAMGSVSPTVLETIIASAIEYFDFAINDWFGVSQFLFFLFITPFVVNITKKLSGFKFRTLVLLFLAQYAVVCGMLCTIYLGASHFGAGRVTNVIYAVFLISMIVIYGYLLGLLQEKEIIKVDFSVIPLFYKNLVSGVCSLVILIGIFLLGSNFYQYSTSGMVLAEMRGNTHKIYQKQMEQRLELLNDDSIKDVVFESHIKSFIFGEESLSENKDDWPNTAVAQYYGKDSVTLKVAE